MGLGVKRHLCNLTILYLNFLGEYAWLIPLAIIIICLVLLLTIIFFCDIRKKRNEKKLVEVEEE